ncbi:TraB/GumN family protein [Sagittula sp. S175]|uniref:TraB/GumN family protein n=1 Tax=Sagittula sp. S175 TaxID=3415129 RepID=UPI003C7D88FB
MKRLFTPLLLWLGLVSAAQAECTGQDLMPGLLPDDRAQVDAQLGTMPYAEGNHWIARKGDEVLHLVGTMHISDTRLDGPVSRLSPLMDDAALLLLEMTEADQKQMEKGILTDPSVFMLKGKTLPDMLSEEDWQALSAALDARGMPPFIGAQMQPWYVSMLLSVPSCMTELLQKKDGLDFRLEAAAQAQGVPTQSLEAYDTFFRLFDDIPMDTQLAMIRAALASPDTNEDLFETMLNSYFTERAAEGQIVLEVLGPRLTPLSAEENDAVNDFMNGALLKERNAAWIPVILDSLETTEGSVVAAFGAAHLAGVDGILSLLEKEGFTLERAPF